MNLIVHYQAELQIHAIARYRGCEGYRYYNHWSWAWYGAVEAMRGRC